MEDNKDDIENIFRDRFSQEEAPVSPRVWANIQKTLPKDNNGGAGVAKRYFLFSLIGVIFLAVAVLLATKSYVKKEEGKIEVESEKKITANEEAKSNTNEFINKNNIEHNDSINNSEFKNNSVFNNLLAKDNKSHSNDGGSTKLTLTNTSSTSKEGAKMNKNNSIQNTVSNTTKISNNNVNKAKGNSNLQNITSTNTNKTNKNKQNSDATLTSNGNLNKSIKKEFSQNTSQKKSTVTNNIVNKTDSDNPDSITPQISNFSNTSYPNKNNSQLDSSHVANSKNKKTEPISFISSDKNKIKDSSSTSKSTKIENNSIVNDKILTTDNNPTVETNPLNTTQKHGDSMNIIALSNGNKKEGETDKLSTTIKDGQKNTTVENRLLSSENKINKDTVIVPNDDQLFLVTNTPPTLSADSLKEITKDSIVSIVSDSTNVDEEKKKKEKNKIKDRWSFDLFLSPMLTGATTKTTDASYQSIVDSKKNQEANRFNFSAGGVINYPILPRITISTGIIYSGYSVSNKFKSSNTYDSTFYQPHIPKDSTDTLKVDKITQSITKKYASTKVDHYNILSLPVAISYCIWREERFTLSATAGIKVNVLLNGLTYIRNDSNTDLIAVSSSVNKITLSYMVSLGIEYKLNMKLSLLVQPAVNFNMSSVYPQSFYLSQKPYSVGVNVGLRFRF